MKMTTAEVQYFITIAPYTREYLKSKETIYLLSLEYSAGRIPVVEFKKRKEEIRQSLEKLWKDIHEKIQRA